MVHKNLRFSACREIKSVPTQQSEYRMLDILINSRSAPPKTLSQEFFHPLGPA